ncbi:MAG TPA: PadR family transcriptional regulator [Angustibacter sp.]|nr:PadR family transcriptional regulator [Angustibacter sp.]
MSPVFAHGQLRLYLLTALADGPKHGYEIIRDLEERFGGLYSPSAGTIYPRLSRLEDEGLVVREDEGRKAVYRITDAGRAELRDRAGDVDDLEVDLERSVRQLAEQVRAQVRGGSKELRAELLAAARTARRSAHDEPAGARPPQARQGQVERAVEELRHGLRAATRREWIDQESVNQIVTIIDRARADVMDVVSRAVDQHRRNP